MPTVGEESVERIRRDHAHMLHLIDRIRAECTERGNIATCNECTASHQGVCHGNIEQMIRAFVETTLKHNLIELMFMEDRVPAAHRIAHNQAHMDIAQQLKAIRVVFAEDSDCLLAIEGIDHVHQTLLSHFREFDEKLEAYLVEAPVAPSY